MPRHTHTVAASLAAIGLALATSITLASPSGVVDQQQPVIDSTGSWALGGASGQMLAQVFTAGVNGALTEVQLPIACAPDGGTVTLEIQGATQDGPDGVVRASQTFPSASFPAFFPAPPSFRSLELDRPVAPLRVGRQYAIVLTASGVCGVFQGPDGDPYADGRAYFISLPNPPSIWVPLGPPSDDLPFMTLGHGGGGGR